MQEHIIHHVSERCVESLTGIRNLHSNSNLKQNVSLPCRDSNLGPPGGKPLTYQCAR